MFLGGQTGHRLEPVRVSSRPFGDRPFLDGLSDFVSLRRGNHFALFLPFLECLVGFLGNHLLHGVLAERIITEIGGYRFRKIILHERDWLDHLSDFSTTAHKNLSAKMKLEKQS